MSLATLRIIEEIAAVGPIKFTRCALVGDASYTAGGSDSFDTLFNTATGEDRSILTVQGIGQNGDLGVEWVNPIGPLAVTVSASGDTFTTEDPHDLNVGDCVEFAADTLPATAPAASTRYYVIASGLTSTVFKVSTAVGGSTINPTTAGTNVTVTRAGRLFVRVPSTGAEATGDLSATTFNLLVTSN